MPSTPTRRPLPALIAMLALLLLTGLVWWRVLHRSSADGATTECPRPSSSATATLPAPPQVTVQVLNATKRTGLASRVRTALVGVGFNIPQQAANDSPKVHIRGVAQIRYGPTGASGARLLHYYLPGATLVRTASKTATVVVSLGDQYRQLASSQTVATQLRTDKIALASAAPTPSGSASPSC